MDVLNNRSRKKVHTNARIDNDMINLPQEHFTGFVKKHKASQTLWQRLLVSLHRWKKQWLCFGENCSIITEEWKKTVALFWGELQHQNWRIEGPKALFWGEQRHQNWRMEETVALFWGKLRHQNWSTKAPLIKYRGGENYSVAGYIHA